MQDIEPYYNWRSVYTAEEDERSPFYEREYSEFFYTDKIYNHYIHPQWDSIGSTTLFLKLLYTDYEDGYAIIELIGEWNDLLYNDIMFLKRDFIDLLTHEGINKFILIGENVMNFHNSDECYYEEWYDDVEDGWIALLNFRKHVLDDFRASNIDSFFVLGGNLNKVEWRTLEPHELYQDIEKFVMKRIG